MPMPVPARLLAAGAVVAGLLPAVTGAVGAGARADATPSYVALGDSYTAGPLVPLPTGDPAGCGRSTSNYPRLVAGGLGLALTDVSCSGARTEHLLAPQAVAGGGVNPPQLDAVTADADLVTVGIGGNDIGFGQILETCFGVSPLGSPCRDRWATPAGDEVSRRIAETGPRVTAVLAEARRRAPSARVLAVGYPAILPAHGPGCWPVMPVADADVAYLRAKHQELNAMIAASAAAAGATYVDVYGPSVGHDACRLPGVKWVEPVVPTAPASPVHPNALGMWGMASAVASAIDPAAAPLPPPGPAVEVGVVVGG